MLVIFDERSSLGLVRLRVKRASSEMDSIFAQILQKSDRGGIAGGAPSPFTEITDEDIDALFND